MNDCYDATMFTLSFPQGFGDPQDWDNFVNSLAPQVQLFWEQATPQLLNRLAGVRRTRLVNGISVQESVRVILRVDNDLVESSWLRLGAKALGEEYRAKQVAAQGNIIAVIVSNEWDGRFDLRWHKPDRSEVHWGNGLGTTQAFEHTREVCRALRGAGARTVLGAYSMRGYTEDDAPDPGLFTWRELYSEPASDFVDDYGVHYYDGGWWVHDPSKPIGLSAIRSDWEAYAEKLSAARLETSTNVNRFMQSVRYWSGFHHKTIYWDESNTNNSLMSVLEHMEACIGKSKLLIHHVNPLGYKLGERVRMFSPFASNGLANNYPAQYVMRDPACYDLVRQHMVEEGYVG